MKNSTTTQFDSTPRSSYVEASEPTVSANILGDRLRAARVNKGLTQERAGDLANLSRSAILQIEAGGRTVSSLELTRLARAYGRQSEEFLSDDEAENDPILVLGRVTKGLSEQWIEEIKPFLNQLEVAWQLSETIGEHSTSSPPLYQFDEPRYYKEAIEQGREMAIRERKRLDLGAAAVDDVAALISCQSIWTTALPLPENVSGLFFQQSHGGLAVLINSLHARARRRFSYSHEYAHALVDRDKMPTPTSRENKSDLIEKRANAFASEFLMPESGVRETLERMQKGAGSREYSLLYDVASDEVLPHETRNDASSQRITVREIAVLAHDFKVSYEVAAYRLSDIGILRRPHLEELLSPQQSLNGRQLREHLEFFDGEEEGSNEQPYLKRQLTLLAIEALRREKISDVQFLDICTNVVDYDTAKAEALFKVASSIV